MGGKKTVFIALICVRGAFHDEDHFVSLFDGCLRQEPEPVAARLIEFFFHGRRTVRRKQPVLVRFCRLFHSLQKQNEFIVSRRACHNPESLPCGRVEFLQTDVVVRLDRVAEPVHWLVIYEVLPFDDGNQITRSLSRQILLSHLGVGVCRTHLAQQSQGCASQKEDPDRFLFEPEELRDLFPAQATVLGEKAEQVQLNRRAECLEEDMTTEDAVECLQVVGTRSFHRGSP